MSVYFSHPGKWMPFIVLKKSVLWGWKSEMCNQLWWAPEAEGFGGGGIGEGEEFQLSLQSLGCWRGLGQVGHTFQFVMLPFKG